MLQNLHVVSTSHIAKESVKQINAAFSSFKPDYVAVELDKQRLQGLLSKQKPSLSPKIIGQIGLLGYLFALVGRFVQQKLGRIVDVEPGADMLEAALLAKNNKLPLLLIDQDLRITLKRLSKKMGWKEKFRLLTDIIIRPKQQKVTFDIRTIPQAEVITTLLTSFKDRYPGLYLVLVHERNIFMARNLATMLITHPEKKIMAVMGAGHEQEVLRMTEKLYKDLHQKEKYGK